jgi:hypothetical protein
MRQAEDDEKRGKSTKKKMAMFWWLSRDALWIEDMNTVLDDSRKLCLPDGSNIRIPKTYEFGFLKLMI